jgi:hypothetical protein
MSFSARVFRVLIASPSDVTEEREAAVRTIQEWNDLNSSERQLVVLPLRWETHSAPEYGKRPQEIINRQIVDHCDMLIGIFWTRIGSPTGVADSGTIEELERVATEGKPVMLYFSRTKIDPDSVDLLQLEKVREFKGKTFPNALVHSYSGIIEFKESLSRHLDIQVKKLLASEGADSVQYSEVLPKTIINLEFAKEGECSSAGSEISLNSIFVDATDFETIPDYIPDEKEEVKSEANALWFKTPNNRNYYRQRVTAALLRNFFVPVRFWLKNSGGVGARDVYIDINIKSNNPGMVVISKDFLPDSAPSKIELSLLSGGSGWPVSPGEVLSKTVDSWRGNIEIKALQPQRELCPGVRFLVGAFQSCDIMIYAKVYADSLSEPSSHELKIHLDVKELQMTAMELRESIKY